MSIGSLANILGGNIPLPSGDTTVVGSTGVSTDNALARWDGTTGSTIQNGVVTEADYTGTLTGATDQATTTAAGLAFTNQPSNDGVEVLSSDAGDTTQTVTIIGTTTGTDTVVVETVTLTGTTFVPTVKTDWGQILAVKKSAATLGTVTVRKATGDGTITAGLTAAVLSVGVTTVTNTAAFNRVLSMVASGATTKQLGFGGTNTAGTQIYDSQALTGATVAVSNVAFFTLTEIYRGDLEATRTATVTTDGSWVLTGGAGQTLSFDSLTGNITATATGTGNFTLLGQAGLRLNFGGITSSFAAILGNGATLKMVLADNSTYANVELANLQVAGSITFSGASLITKPGGTIPLITTSTSITDGAGAQGGTLLNAPTAGNPTKWVRINDNGTTRYIPAW